MSFNVFTRFFLLLFGIIFLLVEFIWVYPNLRINNIISISLILGGFTGIAYYLFTGFCDELAKYEDTISNLVFNLTKMIAFIFLIGFVVSLCGLFYGACS